MVCKLCSGLGHNVRTCAAVMSLEDMFAKLELVSNPKNKKATTKRMVDNQEKIESKTKVSTEDTGKVFEKAICLRYDIEYVGPYKYGLERPNQILPYLHSLPELFPSCVHTAEKGSRYDFTSTDGLKHLSAKTSKRRQAKIAPQVYGQCSVEKLCKAMSWDSEMEQVAFKEKFQNSIIDLLKLFEQHTFDCDIIYYNEARKDVTYLKKSTDIDWSNKEFIWTKHWDKWNNSTTLKVKVDEKFIPIFESQIHSKGRTNMANRWCFDNLLKVFAEHFTITNLSKF